MSEQNAAPNDQWAQQALKEIALEAIREQRRARRWGIFFKLAVLVYLIALVFVVPSCQGGRGVSGRHTAVVSVTGMIAEDSPASADVIIKGLQDAFAAEGVAGVVLKINSPGGSPVQSGLVNDEIRRLRAKHPEIPVYAVVSDLCTSGAYYIAVAADRIYVDKASMVGSIGVLMDSFGFTGAMERLGVERRLYTAGQSKGFLDPFSPEQPRDVEHVRRLLADVHQQFIQVVKEGRGDRLKAGDEIFSGLIWTGAQSVDLGLADALGDVRMVARDVVGAEELVDYTPRMDFFSAFAQRLGASAMQQLHAQLRSQALW